MSELGQEKAIVAVDSQKLDMMQVCEQKFDYVFNKHLTAPEMPLGIERGSLIHEGMEYRHACFAKGIEPDLTEARKLMEAKALGMSLPLEEVEECIRVFGEYCDYYSNDRNQYEFMTVEEVGSKILYEDDNLVILYETKIDVITRLKSQGVLLPWDTKSYSRKSPIIPLSDQFMGYCWMLEANNLMVNRVGFQKTLKPKDKYTREIFSYSFTQIEEWKEKAIFWIKRTLANYQQNNWVQNNSSCAKFNTECLFLPLCKSQKEDRGRKAAALFNIGQAWDIGAKL